MGIPSDFSNTGLTGFKVSSTKLVKIEQQYKGVRGKNLYLLEVESLSASMIPELSIQMALERPT